MKYSVAALQSAIGSALSPDDEVVLAFSGLWSIAAFLGTPRASLCPCVLEAVLDAVGPRRTLVMPAYDWSFCRTGTFDAAATPSQCGVLTEMFRRIPGVRFTRSPLNRHCVIGPRADELCAVEGQTLWGEGSEMAWFDHVGARMLRIGCGEWNLGYFHRLEEVAGVPYRYFKRFSGTWTDGRESRHATVVMYVRALDAPVDYVWSTLARELDKRRLIVKTAPTALKIESALARDILRTGTEMLRADPFCFLRDPAAARAWAQTARSDRSIPRDQALA